MRYISTRGDQTERAFCEILLEGLAPDGGLYLPTHYPKIDDATLTRWRGLYGNGQPGGYADLAFAILSLYIDDIPADDLRALVRKTYTKAVYGTDAIVPVRRLAGDLHLAVFEKTASNPAARIAEAVRTGPGGPHTLVVGHPYVDIWQAVKPARVGLPAWPTVPRSVEWKHGICQALGWPHRTQADIAQAWQRGGQGTPMRRALLAGLLLSLVGDVALLWPQQGFLPGLVAFLLAHLAYLWGFTRGVRLASSPAAFAGYALLAAAVLALLWPGVPAGLRPPVLAYVVCLAAMAAQAACVWRAALARGPAAAVPAVAYGRLAAIGGGLFLCSDALLAFNRFHTPLPLATLWILGSYWAAQWCIASSLPRRGAVAAGAQRLRM